MVRVNPWNINSENEIEDVISAGAERIMLPIMLAIRIYLYQILKFNTSVCIAVMSISGWLVPILVIEVLRRILPQKFYKPFRYLMGV